MKKMFIILWVIFPCISYGQSCDCQDHFEWTKKTFEENDAGVAYALDLKGKEAYDAHNNVFANKVDDVQNEDECFELLSEWLNFFRNGHHGIEAIEEDEEGTTGEMNEAAIIEKFKDWESVDVDIEAFKRELDQQEEPGLEGIWQLGAYTVGIKQQGKKYVGFIIEADEVYWRAGQVKLTIAKEEGTMKAIFYMKDHSAEKLDEVALWGKGYLSIGQGFSVGKRLYPEAPSNEAIERYVGLIDIDEPILFPLSEQTLLLRIPYFDRSEKELIDSVIINNKDKLLSTENLIIDLRNNGGGNDASFQELIPLIYTNPMRSIGLKFFSTPLNNQGFKSYMDNPNVSEDERAWAKNAYEILSEHLGEFVSLGDNEIGIRELDTVYQYPSKVGIMINEENASTTEQFLLAAKQSKKVKLFGVTTAGILDISNMYRQVSPCEDFELWYSLSKSNRIPDMAIDGKGIQPDYYIDSSIPPYGWIDFVQQTLEEKELQLVSE